MGKLPGYKDLEAACKAADKKHLGGTIKFKFYKRCDLHMSARPVDS